MPDCMPVPTRDTLIKMQAGQPFRGTYTTHNKRVTEETYWLLLENLDDLISKYTLLGLGPPNDPVSKLLITFKEDGYTNAIHNLDRDARNHIEAFPFFHALHPRQADTIEGKVAVTINLNHRLSFRTGTDIKPSHRDSNP